MNHSMMLRRLLLAAALLLTTLGLTTTTALADDTASVFEGERGRLVLLLSHFHDVPAPEQLTAEPTEHFLDIARDTTLARLPRQRAIEVLATRPEPEVRAFAAELVASSLADSNELPMLRRGAELVAALAPSDAVWALELFAPLAAHEDYVVRRSVVRGLIALRNAGLEAPAASELLTQLVIAERNPMVREELAAAFAPTSPVEPHPGIDLPQPPLPTRNP